MRREPHPLTGTMYEDIGDGKVKVQKEGSNSYGVFTWQGEWLEGEVTQADPQMLLYIGGPDLPRDHEVMWMSSPSKAFDGTIPMEAFPSTHMDDFKRGCIMAGAVFDDPILDFVDIEVLTGLTEALRK